MARTKRSVQSGTRKNGSQGADKGETDTQEEENTGRVPV